MIDTKNNTITVEGIAYDIETRTNVADGGEHMTVTLDGEDVFEGLEATVGYDDESGGSPRDWSNVGTMSMTYKDYIIGGSDDIDIEKEDFTVECDKCGGTGQIKGLVEILGGSRGSKAYSDTCDKCDGEGELRINPVDYYRKVYGARVIMPLYVYEHGSITISTGAPIKKLNGDDLRSSGRFMGDDAGWDTTTVGFVFDTPKGIKECIGEDATDEQIMKALDSEIENLASYLEGDVTYYNVEDEETGFHDSCYGFVGGNGKYTKEECYQALETAIEKRLKENVERAECNARGIITI